MKEAEIVLTDDWAIHCHGVEHFHCAAANNNPDASQLFRPPEGAVGLSWKLGKTCLSITEVSS